MADNTDEEHLDNPTNTQSENPSDEIIPTKDTEIINPNQETENMEVHHHPDLHHKPKKWREYFLEFLMIFLAVSMGFIARKISGKISSTMKRREGIWKLKLINLKDDTSQIQLTILFNENRVKILDTLLSLQDINNPDTLHSGFFNALFMRSFTTNYFISNNAAIEQMKSSGSLRLVKRKTVLDGIFNYGYENNIVTSNENYADMWMNRLSENASKFMKFRKVFPGLKPIASTQNNTVSDLGNNQRVVMLEFFNDVAALRTVLSNYYLIELHAQQRMQQP